MEQFIFGVPDYIYNLLNLSTTASVVIIAVLILRFFMRNLPKKYSYMLWGIVAFRLICPFSFKSILSIFNLSTLINSKVETNSVVHQITEVVNPLYVENTTNYIDNLKLISIERPFSFLSNSLGTNFVWLFIIFIIVF